MKYFRPYPLAFLVVALVMVLFAANETWKAAFQNENFDMGLLSAGIATLAALFVAGRHQQKAELE